MGLYDTFPGLDGTEKKAEKKDEFPWLIVIIIAILLIGGGAAFMLTK